MLKERFRLMFFTRNGTDIKQISLDNKQILLFGILGSSALIIFLLVSVVLSNRFTQNLRVISLEMDRKMLHRELVAVKDKLSKLSDEVSSIEMRGDELRNAASLAPIDEDLRQVGVGGRSYYGNLEFAYHHDEVSNTATEVRLDLDKLERAIQLENSNLTEIAAKLKEMEWKRNHYPSIIPVIGGPITSNFGWRIHPLTGKMKPHEGIDITVPTGRKVLATADGVANVVKIDFTPHKDYGMYIVLDHGNGFQTLYGHLSKVYVKKGQSVNRWDPIGEVGETGATSGPHLHYEVHYNETPVNPRYFIFN